MGRLRSGWFRVYSDILDDTALQAVGPAVAMAYINVLAMLNRQGSEDGWLHLPEAALPALAMVKTAAKAERALRALEKVELLSFHRHDADDASTTHRRGVDCSVFVRKWPELQGLDVTTKTEDEDEDNHDGGRASHDDVQGPMPDPFPPAWREDLLTWATKHGWQERVDDFIERIRDWHERGRTANARRPRNRKGWVATIRNAIRDEMKGGGSRSRSAAPNGQPNAKASAQERQKNAAQGAFDSLMQKHGVTDGR